MQDKTLRVYLIAGEPSGDLLGSRLMRALKKQGPVSFFGLGGETMQMEGLSSLFDIKELSIMGFLEIVPKIPHLLKRMRQVILDIERVKPDIVVTIDSWSFSVAIHKRLIKRGCKIPRVHYVAPQAWAWKKGRAKHLKDLVGCVFSLLPYEKDFFAPYKAPLYYVGHPVIEGGADLGDKERFYKTHHFRRDDFIVCLLPGSRQNEVKYLLPVFKEIVPQLKVLHPRLKLVIPTVDTVSKTVKDYVKDWTCPVLFLKGEKERYDAFAAAKGAIAASGTVSLELSMSKLPHIVVYKVNKLTALLARFLLHIKFVNLVNILENKEIIPELIQEKCTAPLIIETFEKTIRNEGKAQKQGVLKALQKLGYGEAQSPSEKAANKIREIVNGQ
ncbi:MAG: lipid-A-disaccharide synthase [Alphaproteobacteria bacterium]|nr:lipid-A-disaccharide synthase [Alphaproteobacteria bacterium]